MSDGIKDGGFAFPQPIAINSAGDVEHSEIPGMSLRDYLAGQALTGLLAGKYTPEATYDGIADRLIAEEPSVGLKAYEIADAMLEAREPNLAGEISALDELGTIRLDVVLALSDMDKGREGNVNLRLEDIKRRIDKALARAGEKS